LALPAGLRPDEQLRARHSISQTLAEYFRKVWSTHVGPADLIYTRTPEGRRFLLKARTHSMSRSFQTRAERLKSWQ
jgi:hypothetical protein